MKSSFIPVILAAMATPAFAQLNDAPAVDMKQVLQGLKQFKEQNETGLKTRRDAAYRAITTAAASNEAASAFWTNAVLAVQFAGVDHQTAAVRDWKQTEGEGLKAKEGANAARLHLVWLGITMQHAAGVETSKLLPAVVDFVKQIETDGLAMNHLADQIDKAKANAKRGVPNKALADETQAKKVHDSILRTSVAGSPVAKQLQIGDLISSAARRKQKGDEGEGGGWEPVPGNVNGIYTTIILPEFRAAKDPRILDYWDMVIRKGQENIYAGMPDYEEKQWSQVKRPSLLWARAQDTLAIGLRNRAITEMFNLIKAFPQHPEAAGWISHLEQLASGVSGASAAVPAQAVPATRGVVAPPVAVPPATSPGVPPTATIIPAAPAPTR